MPYIPDNWIRNKNNWPEISRVMDCLDRDIITPEIKEEQAGMLQHLLSIGEDIIYQQIVTGNISFGA